MQHDNLQAEEEKLTTASQRLQAKVDSFRTKKETIKATYTAAEAQTRINEAFSGISEEMGDVGLAIQRAEDKTAQMQARAGAIDELLASGALDDYSGQRATTSRPSSTAWAAAGRGAGAGADEGRARPGPGAEERHRAGPAQQAAPQPSSRLSRADPAAAPAWGGHSDRPNHGRGADRDRRPTTSPCSTSSTASLRRRSRPATRRDFRVKLHALLDKVRHVGKALPDDSLEPSS